MRRAAALLVLALLLVPPVGARYQGPRPDLVALAIDLNPGQPGAGDRMTFTTRYENIGNTSAGPFKVEWWVDGESIGRTNVSGIPAFSQSSVTSPPWTATQGTHRVRTMLDVLDEVDELEDDNNTRERDFGVGPPRPRPDLALVEVRLTPEVPRAGANLTFVAVVRNAGALPAPASAVAFEVNGAPLGNAPLGALAPGATGEASVTAIAQPGSHALRAVVDAAQALEEADEANNVLERGYTVVGSAGGAALLPDLDIAELRTEPPAPVAGDAVSLVAAVRNRGDAPAGSFLVELFLGGASLGRKPVQGLAPGARAEVSATWVATAGDATFRAVADAAAQVFEADEANNARDARVLVNASRAGAAPDLRIALFVSALQEAHEGDNVTFTAQVLNDGAPTGASVMVDFRMDGASFGKRRVNLSVERGGAVVLSPVWVAVAGNHTAEVVADSDDTLPEADEGNNRATLAVRVAAGRGLPDLRILALEPGVSEPRAGDKAPFHADVLLAGGRALERVTVAFTLDGASLGERVLDRLEPQVIRRVNSDPWTATAGNHTVRVVLDPGNVHEEADEANNAREASFAVGPADNPLAAAPLPALLALGALALAAAARGRRLR